MSLFGMNAAVAATCLSRSSRASVTATLHDPTSQPPHPNFFSLYQLSYKRIKSRPLFRPELPGMLCHVRDPSGNSHDLIIMERRIIDPGLSADGEVEDYVPVFE
jgi:hypothetical protein